MAASKQRKLKDIINIKTSQDDGISGKKFPLGDSSVDISELMKKALQAPKGRARRSPPPLAAAGDGDPQQDTSTQKQQLQTDTPSPHNKDIPSSDTMLQTSSFTPTIDAKSKRQEEVPLAAKTLMKAHNRRKSVFQRPSRYGEWFDGDDDELERMVEEEECDEINDALPHKAAQDDVANKVHAIANSLCEKLDGLIEESPAVKAAPTDSKSLRDKLLESWEGRSYYDRLMQMAGINNEREEEIRQQLQKGHKRDSAPTSGGKEDDTVTKNESSHAFLSPPKKPRLRVDIDSLPGPDMAPKALSTTAVKKAINLALDTTQGPATTTGAVAHNVKGVLKKNPVTAQAPLVRSNSTNSTINANTKAAQDSSGKLLRVSSARGPKPSAAWQTDGQPLQKQKSVRIVEDPAATIESLRSQVQSLSISKVTAETEIGQLKIKLKHAQDKAMAEAEARKAAENRIALLEAELQSLRGDDGSKAKGRSTRRKS